MIYLNQKGFETFRTLLIVLVLLLAVSNAATIYWVMQKNKPAVVIKENQTTTTTPLKVDTVETIASTSVIASSTEISKAESDDIDGDGISNEEETTKYKTDPYKSDTDGDGYSDKQEIDSGYNPLAKEFISENDLGANQIYVDWQEWPVRIVYNKIYNYDDLIKYIKNTEEYKNDEKTYGKAEANKIITTYENSFNSYEVGTITAGEYKGKKLYLVFFVDPFGMGSLASVFRVVENKEKGPKPIILTLQSNKTFGLLDSIFNIDKKTTIANLEPLSEIKIPKSKLNFIKTEEEPLKLLTDYADAKKIFAYATNKYIYKSLENGCFLTRANDGTARVYYFSWQVSPQKGFGELQDYTNGIPLTLNYNNSTVKANYSFSKLTGCGTSGCFNYPKYINNNQLVALGTFSNGEKIFELKDKNFSYTPAGGKKTILLKEIYNNYYPGQDKKLLYEDFLKNKPLIYWQDPFGDFVELRNAKFQPAVECGKPVIYLYPTKTTTVSVQVAPGGGFSKTLPEYGKGWQVEAKPTGELKNLSDGKIYPYLFWEGQGLNYHQPDEGFVVSKDEMKNFLQDKLSKLGLNASEAGEFIDFWLPRMQAKPYYFVTFLPQEQFDRLAPLSVEPKPDTVIRVFMDYSGLDQRITVKEQRIVTPRRKGFTVVEWGGALHN